MLRYFQTTALLLCLTAIGCLTPEAALQKKDPDTVVKFASRKLDGKRPKTAWAKALETAFAQANKEDLLLIEELKLLGTVAAWEQIHDIHEGMERRHQRVEPLLPLISEDGYRPDIRLLPVADMLAESRQEVIELSLPVIEESLRNAQGGHRLQARAAYARILQLKKKYQWEEQLADELQYKALALGRTYVLVDLESRWHFFDYNRVVDRLNFWGIGNDDLWQVVHMNQQPGVNYDFRAAIVILDANVSSDHRSTNTATYTKQIEVGREEVKDTNGVVISSNPIYENITATVEEVRAWKDASLTAQITIYDYPTGQEVLNQMIWETDNYSTTSCSISGDSRAFSGCCTGGIILFPSDWCMIDNCTDDLRFRLNCLLQQVDIHT